MLRRTFALVGWDSYYAGLCHLIARGNTGFGSDDFYASRIEGLVI